MKKAKLFIIDPQVDFCDPHGTLYVKNAEHDITRLSNMIKNNLDSISKIVVTLDSHNIVQIFHPIWWVDENGKNPEPFKTVITEEDVLSGKWRCFKPEYQERSLEYVQNLKENGRYLLVIWSYHCLQGSVGSNIMPELFDALSKWELKGNLITKVIKGMNIFTEQYSPFEADVPDFSDRNTLFNYDMYNTLEEGEDDILIAGEALSHCVASGVKSLANALPQEDIKRLVLLTDACSNVEGFEDLGKTFVNEMVEMGMRLSTTTTYF